MSRENLAGVPEAISRRAYQDMVRGLGFDLKDLVSLKFHRDGIHAEVIARTEDGHAFTIDGEHPATHQIYVRIIDDPDLPFAAPRSPAPGR